MKDILIIASRRSLIRETRKIVDSEGIDRVDLMFCATIDDIIRFVHNDLPASVEVVLSLPGIASLLSRELGNRLPILTIEYNNIDIIQALRKANAICPGTVAMGNYLKENQRLDDIREFTDRPFVSFVFGDGDAANRNILRSLHAREINAVVGGGYICNLAREVGFSVFPLEVSHTTLRETIESALSIADTRRYARYSRRRIDTILEQQSEAVVTVDQRGVVTTFNKSAEAVFNTTSEIAVGRVSRKVFPTSCFDDVLKAGEPLENIPHTVQDVDIIASYRPVLDNGNIIGAVGTFTTMADIQRKDESVRRYLAPKSVRPRHDFSDFGSHGPIFNRLVERARCYAKTDETILITGESGAGKEVMASAIHNASRRNSKPFLAINCAAIPASLMESELFGYEPGAFTGARKKGSPGLFELTHGGTLFLDEIGELPPELQSKLLRVIQEREVRRIGSAGVIPVDVRLLAATNKKLRAEVDANRFRADLFYRLNVLRLHMPPLRDYAESIPAIVCRMLHRLASGDVGADAKCAELSGLIDKAGPYGWPGNLRELDNVVRRYLALSPLMGHMLTPHDIFDFPSMLQSEIGEAADIQMKAAAEEVMGPVRMGCLQEEEYRRILTVYRSNDCNCTRTAKELGISRSTLWRKLKRGRRRP